MTIDTFKQQFHFDKLDAQQTAAAAATEGPVLLLAVPGSGKTTTLLARLGYLVYGRQVDPACILTCTYTVAATNEMRTRFRARFGGEYADRLEFRTINGVCARIIALYERLGHTAFTLVTDDNRRFSILRDAWQGAGHKFPTDSDLRGMSTAITYVKNQMLPDAQADAVTFSSSEGPVSIGPVYRSYRDAMRRNRWMDYDDQMVYACAILRQCPEVLARLQARYRYFCVDEAQDTSRIQHQVIALLASRSRNLLMVGDEDQSIYGFRAACPQALMDFEKNWPGARVLFMEQNYRSTPQIVEAADRFIRLNKNRRDKRMRAVHPDGEKVAIRPCTSRTQQYEVIAQMAREASETGGQIAVLYRNNDTALPIMDLLDRQGIAYQAKGVDSLFFSSRIVSDVKDLFSLAFHPDDRETYLRLYYKLGIYMRKGVAELPVQGNLFRAYRQLGEEQVPSHLKRLLAERAAQLEEIARSDSPASAIRTMDTRMGYGEYLERSGIDPFRLDILAQLAEREHTIAGFLARLDQLQALVSAGGNGNTAPCILSTIHSSKGLEYDHVVLADAVIGVLPMEPSSTASAEERTEQQEEERRLFYVGITRAKKRLTVLAVDKSASPFVRYLQAMLGQHPAKKAPRLSANLLSLPSRDAEPVQTVDLSGYQTGTKVCHTVFGPGLIRERDSEIAVIEFEAGCKTLSLPFAVQSRLLQVESADAAI